MIGARADRIAVGACVVALLAAGCHSGGSSSAPAKVSLKVRTVAADVAPPGASVFAAGQSGQPLAVGDRVRTDATGFAEVDYPDGSLVRLDASSELRIGTLTDEHQVQRVVSTLTRGRLWNRVKTITSSEGRYEVDTQYADATVRDPSFIVDCRAASACSFTTYEGAITLTDPAGRTLVLHAGQQVAATAAGFGKVTTLSKEMLLTDAFLARNLVIDEPGVTTTLASAYLSVAAAANAVSSGVDDQLDNGPSPAEASRIVSPEVTADREEAAVLRQVAGAATGALARDLVAEAAVRDAEADLDNQIGGLTIVQYVARLHPLAARGARLAAAIRRQLGLPPPPSV